VLLTAQEEGGAASFRQVGDSGADRDVELGDLGRVGLGGGRPTMRDVEHSGLHRPLTDRLCSCHVDDTVAHGCDQVGAQRAGQIQVGAAEPQAEEDVVDYILGGTAVPEVCDRVAQERRMVRPEHLLEGGAATTADRLDERELRGATGAAVVVYGTLPVALGMAADRNIAGLTRA